MVFHQNWLGKFAERMAKGGLVKMKPNRYADGGVVTDTQISDKNNCNNHPTRLVEE